MSLVRLREIDNVQQRLKVLAHKVVSKNLNSASMKYLIAQSNSIICHNKNNFNHTKTIVLF